MQRPNNGKFDKEDSFIAIFYCLNLGQLNSKEIMNLCAVKSFDDFLEIV